MAPFPSLGVGELSSRLPFGMTVHKKNWSLVSILPSWFVSFWKDVYHDENFCRSDDIVAKCTIGTRYFEGYVNE